MGHAGRSDEPPEDVNEDSSSSDQVNQSDSADDTEEPLFGDAYAWIARVRWQWRVGGRGKVGGTAGDRKSEGERGR